MSHDAQLLLLGAAIALVSCLATLIVTVLLLHRRGDAAPRKDGPEMAEWTTRYVQSMREATAARKDGPNPSGPSSSPLPGEKGAGR